MLLASPSTNFLKSTSNKKNIRLCAKYTVLKGTNHAIFDLIRRGGARAKPRSLHRFVGLIFPHFRDSKFYNFIQQ